MKFFSEVRKSVSDTVVYDKKINRIPVKIIQSGKKFTLYIDDDKLDNYPSEKEALTNAKAFIKELGK